MLKKIFKKIIVSVISWEARLVLRKYKPKIVGVTGSVGKTSTKDAIFTVLSSVYFARKSEKSFNSEIGIPLTILGQQNAWNNPLAWIKIIFNGLMLAIFRHNYPKWLVLEVGADRPGDIRRTARWLRPDVVVVTRFGEVPVHVEYFGSREEIIREKSWLAREAKHGSVLVINADDPDVVSFAKFAKGKILTYGFNKNSDIVATNKSIIYDNQNGADIPQGIAFKVENRGNTLPVFVDGSLGSQHIYPVLAALAVGSSQNLNFVSMIESLNKHVLPKGRMKLVEGSKGSVLIDDTYNSSPVALEEALKTLGSVKNSGRKVAVLGDMLELGRFSIEEHKKAGKTVVASCDILITAGVRAKYIADGALENGFQKDKVASFDDSRKAGEYLKRILQAGDVALVKGSQSMRMEKAVKLAMVHQSKAEELLVRQEKEWQKR